MNDQDLTLQEALELYEDECREVLDSEIREDIEGFVTGGNLPGEWASHCEESMYTALIGACVVWLAGKVCANQLPLCMHDTSFEQWHSQPLRFYLDEVKAHME